MAGILYLIPNVLAEGTANGSMPSHTIETALRLRYFAIEEIRSARRLLRSWDKSFPIDDSTFWPLTKDTDTRGLAPMLYALKQGHDVGVISEAGCPGVADPGALLVAAAHAQGVQVVPLVGPSSFLLALMGSGLNGQCFAFHGYLPIEEPAKVRALKELEANSRKLNMTQLFMETPYRNVALWALMLKHLAGSTRLSVSIGLTGPEQYVQTHSVKEWQSKPLPPLNKVPAVFLLLA